MRWKKMEDEESWFGFPVSRVKVAGPYVLGDK